MELQMKYKLSITLPEIPTTYPCIFNEYAAEDVGSSRLWKWQCFDCNPLQHTKFYRYVLFYTIYNIITMYDIINIIMTLWKRS